MRRIAQPGPAAATRIQCVPANGRAFEAVLLPGPSLLDAAHACFRAAGFAGGVLSMSGGALAPFGYVIPALSETSAHAAFYSAPFRPHGASRITTGAMTVGTRDGAPFFHCHALWTESDGSTHCGHILPEETGIAAPIPVRCLGLHGAAFTAEPDPETGFKLFGPVADGTAPASPQLFALRLRPHEDITGALEEFCGARGIRSARLHGGVGSIIGARFADGRALDAFATEIAVADGHIAPGPDGAPQASVDIALIDYTGAIATGRLARGDNPIFITLELVLAAEG